MLIKKIYAGVFLVSMFIISGCGNNDFDKNTNATVKQDKLGKSSSDAISENLPVATGKVDDTVDAIINGAEDESKQVVSDSADAQASISSGEEAENLSNIYDQNEF